MGQRENFRSQGEAMSKFEDWFKKQFGKLPIELRPQHHILHDLIEARKKVTALERELYEQRRIHYSFEGAMFSSNASDSFKEKA
jgi:hypothetical protein